MNIKLLKHRINKIFFVIGIIAFVSLVIGALLMSLALKAGPAGFAPALGSFPYLAVGLAGAGFAGVGYLFNRLIISILPGSSSESSSFVVSRIENNTLSNLENGQKILTRLSRILALITIGNITLLLLLCSSIWISANAGYFNDRGGTLDLIGLAAAVAGGGALICLQGSVLFWLRRLSTPYKLYPDLFLPEKSLRSKPYLFSNCVSVVLILVALFTIVPAPASPTELELKNLGFDIYLPKDNKTWQINNYATCSSSGIKNAPANPVGSIGYCALDKTIYMNIITPKINHNDLTLAEYKGGSNDTNNCFRPTKFANTHIANCTVILTTTSGVVVYGGDSHVIAGRSNSAYKKVVQKFYFTKGMTRFELSYSIPNPSENASRSLDDFLNDNKNQLTLEIVEDLIENLQPISVEEVIKYYAI